VFHIAILSFIFILLLRHSSATNEDQISLVCLNGFVAENIVMNLFQTEKQ